MSLQATFVLCRLFHYGAAMLLFGASTFTWVLAPPELADALGRGMWRLAAVTTLILGLSATSWLLLAAGSMGEGWPDAVNAGTIGAVLAGTEFGRVWQLHLVLVLALLAGIATRRSSLTWAISALVLASLGLIGHATMHAGPSGWLHRATLAVHLLCGGFWFGALAPLRPTLRLMGEPALRGDAIVALRRFSTVGHGAVVIVLATGVVNAALILGIGPFDPRSPYQALLAAKVALVGLMIAIAVINRYRLVPRLRADPDASRAIMNNSVAGLILGATVIALVSLLGLLEPGP